MKHRNGRPTLTAIRALCELHDLRIRDTYGYPRTGRINWGAGPHNRAASVLVIDAICAEGYTVTLRHYDPVTCTSGQLQIEVKK